jgi:ribosomal 50S subunit-recycling heat shock protein
MRLDVFLKAARLVKRRAVARAVCEAGLVRVNGRVAKPGTRLGPGDRVEVRLGVRMLEVRVLGEPEGRTAPRAGAPLYELVREAALEPPAAEAHGPAEPPGPGAALPGGR